MRCLDLLFVHLAGPGAKKDGCFRRRFNPAFDRLLPFFPNSSFSKVACQTRFEANSYVNCKQSLSFARNQQGKTREGNNMSVHERANVIREAASRK